MTDNKGRAVNGYDYDPFGNSLFERTQQANPFQYDSGYLDNDTSLYQFGTRYYDPGTGRWTQKDPVGGSLADLNSANRYTYAGDDPINVVDPGGELGFSVIFSGYFPVGVSTNLNAVFIKKRSQL